MFEATSYIQRRASLMEQIHNGLILLPGHSESSMNYAGNTYPFRQNSNFLYFIGIDLPDLVAIIDTVEQKTILFGDELTLEDVIWTGPLESIKDRAARSGILETKPLSALMDFIEKGKRAHKAIHYLPQSRLENWSKLSTLLELSLNEIHFSFSKTLIKAVVDLRSIKSIEEISSMESAASIGYEMHLHAMKMALPGISERSIAGWLEGHARSYGMGVSFPSIVSQKGEVLHNHNHSDVLQKGRMLLCDAGAESLEHYASDFTRTTPIGGNFTSRQRELYQMVVDANNCAIKNIKPEVSYKDVHLSACTILAEGLKSVGILRGDMLEAVHAGAHALFMPHGLGHMIGLDVHDMEDLGEDFVGYDDQIHRSSQFGLRSLRLGRTLKAGFTLTVEPGLYFIPELIQKWESEKQHAAFINYQVARSYIGFGGIRLEDNVLVTEDGNRFIGKRLPITPSEVEGLF